MTQPFVTTGVPTTPDGTGAVPLRREIRDLQANFPEQWDLFLLALTAFQNVNEDDQTSYYQISGIHGCPYVAWNGVTSQDGAGGGYCTHSSIVFLPWHRPYLALFEQLLCQKAQTIASQYSTTIRDRYVAAAQQLRLPFWDWGLAQSSNTRNVFPDSVAAQKISVTGTDGKKQTINNPLYQYVFNAELSNPSRDFPDAPFNSLPNTVRYPTSSTSATSQDSRVTSTINSQSRQIRSQIRWLFENMNDFGSFSNDMWNPGNPGSYASLEDIHNNIHVLTGGTSIQGNMSIVPYAAFDPVFWLHHCNVDRLFAIWQVINPNSYVTPQQTESGTFTEAALSTEDETTSLTPFWQNSSAFHTSDGVRTTETFGHAYPETQSWAFSSTQEYQQDVINKLNQLYAASVPVPVTSNPQGIIAMKTAVPPTQLHSQSKLVVKRQEIPLVTPPAENKSLKDLGLDGPFSDTTVFAAQLPQNPDSPPPEPENRNATYTEWITNIRVQKHCLGGTFQVYVFIGDVPETVDSWLTDENNVGIFSVLGSSHVQAQTGCANCADQAQRQLVVTGVVHLTETLAQAVTKGELRSLEPVDVEPYLKEKLHWRVVQPNGTEKDRTEVADLKVSVVSTRVAPPTRPGEFPSHSRVFTVHPACTEGRPAGFGEGDEI